MHSCIIVVTIGLFEGRQPFMSLSCIVFSLLPPTNEVCEGYVFTGVCLSTGGVWQTPPPLFLGRHPPSWADTHPGQNPPPRGRRPLGRHPRATPPPMLAYGQQAGGTHSTGMFSCSSIFWSFLHQWRFVFRDVLTHDIHSLLTFKALMNID